MVIAYPRRAQPLTEIGQALAELGRVWLLSQKTPEELEVDRVKRRYLEAQAARAEAEVDERRKKAIQRELLAQAMGEISAGMPGANLAQLAQHAGRILPHALGAGLDPEKAGDAIRVLAALSGVEDTMRAGYAAGGGAPSGANTAFTTAHQDVVAKRDLQEAITRATIAANANVQAAREAAQARADVDMAKFRERIAREDAPAEQALVDALLRAGVLQSGSDGAAPSVSKGAAEALLRALSGFGQIERNRIAEERDEGRLDIAKQRLEFDREKLEQKRAEMQAKYGAEKGEKPVSESERQKAWKLFFEKFPDADLTIEDIAALEDRAELYGGTTIDNLLRAFNDLFEEQTGLWSLFRGRYVRRPQPLVPNVGRDALPSGSSSSPSSSPASSAVGSPGTRPAVAPPDPGPGARVPGKVYTVSLGPKGAIVLKWDGQYWVRP